MKKKEEKPNPEDVVYCFTCGSDLFKEVCLYTLEVNKHLGTVIMCEGCLDKAALRKGDKKCPEIQH